MWTFFFYTIAWISAEVNLIIGDKIRSKLWNATNYLTNQKLFSASGPRPT